MNHITVNIPKKFEKDVLANLERRGYKVLAENRDKLVEKVFRNWLGSCLSSGHPIMDEINMDLFDAGYIVTLLKSKLVYEYKERGW